MARVTHKEAIALLGREIKELRAQIAQWQGKHEEEVRQHQRTLDQLHELRSVPLFVNAYAQGVQMPLAYFSNMALLELLHTFERDGMQERSVLSATGAPATVRQAYTTPINLICAELSRRGIQFADEVR